MQNHLSFQRKGLHRSFLFLLLSSFLLGNLVADPASSTTTQTPTTNSATTSTTAKSNSQSKKKTTDSTSTTTAPTKQPNVTVLPPVIVTAATRDPQPVDTTATSTTVVTHQDLTQQNYANVVDALTTVPGLTLGVHGTPGQTVSVLTRGTDSAATLLTIDGRRQAPDISGFYDFANLTLDNVDQIEQVRTPSSAIQGGNAVGGVINIVTLDGRGVDPQGSVAFEAGSFDTFREIAASRGSVDDFNYSVGFSRQDSHFPRPNSAYDNSVYRGNYGYQFSPEVYFDVQTSYTTSDAGSPGSTAFGPPDLTADLFRETWNISPRVTAQVTDFYTTTLYYNRTQLRQVYADPTYDSHNRTQTDTDSIDWQNDFQIASNWKVTSGIQSDKQNVHDMDDIAGTTDIENSLFNIGGYIQSQWEIVKNLNLLNSIRYDAYSDYKGAFSWRQGVSYSTPETNTLLHASVSSSYRPPTVAELYFPPSFGFPTSNPNLVPEESLGWEVGVAQPFFNKQVQVSATYFHNKIDNLITSDASTGYVPFNVGSATTDGVELGIDAQVCDQVRLNINYTYLNAYDDDTHMRLSERPRDTTNFTAVWTPIDALTFSTGGTWVVDREASPGVPQEDYFVLRVSGTWKINDTFSLWARGENILNESYAVWAGYPSLGAGGYGGVKVSF